MPGSDTVGLGDLFKLPFDKRATLPDRLLGVFAILLVTGLPLGITWMVVSSEIARAELEVETALAIESHKREVARLDAQWDADRKFKAAAREKERLEDNKRHAKQRAASQAERDAFSDARTITVLKCMEAGGSPQMTWGGRVTCFKKSCVMWEQE